MSQTHEQVVSYGFEVFHSHLILLFFLLTYQ